VRPPQRRRPEHELEAIGKEDADERAGPASRRGARRARRPRGCAWPRPAGSRR
jgi:hypothetical protein